MTVRLSPDGLRYLAIAEGKRVPRPFHYRWLVPFLAGDNEKLWRAANLVGAVMVAGSTATIAAVHFGHWWAAVAAAMVVLSLPGVVDIARRFPILVDLPAMGLAAMAAADVELGYWWAAIPVALLAGMTKETAPVFAALWCLNPIPLIGLVPVAIRALQKPGREVDGLPPSARDAVTRPWRTSVIFRKGTLRDFEAWVAPWGIGMLGWWWPPAWPAIVVAYAQCLVATDRVRLYQWAGPPVAVGVAGLVGDPRWLVPLAVICWFRPWHSDGV